MAKPRRFCCMSAPSVSGALAATTQTYLSTHLSMQLYAADKCQSLAGQSRSDAARGRWNTSSKALAADQPTGNATPEPGGLRPDRSLP
jgi:hypothetical protein